MLFCDEDAQRGPLTRADAARGVGVVLAVFIATRLVVWSFAYAGALLNVRIELGLKPPFELYEKELAARLHDPASREYALFLERFAHFRPLLNFDGLHYRSIVQNGYRYRPVSLDAEPAERQQNIAFFPLYPLTASLLTPLLGVHGAMIFVSHAAALAAALVLHFWITWRVDAACAAAAVACVLCLPSACYYSFGYAESTTLLMTVLTLACLDAGRLLPAALACGLATATRPTAAALVPVFLLAAWARRAPRGARQADPSRERKAAGGPNRPDPRRPPLPDAHGSDQSTAVTYAANSVAPRNWTRLLLLAPLSIAGITAYAGYLTYRFGSPLVYFTNFRVGWVPDKQRADWFQFVTLARAWDQFKYFGRTLSGLPESVVTVLKPFTWNMPMSLGLVAVSLAAWRVVPRSFRPLLLLAPLIFLQSYLASGGATFGVEPIGRYMGVATPALVILGIWMQRRWPAGLRAGAWAAMMVLQAAWAFHFGLDEWSG